MSLARWLDLLYPPGCTLCSIPLRAGRYLCSSCRDGLNRIEQPFCIQCGEPFDGELPEDVLCTGCRGREFSFEFARASHRARDEALELVHAFKYGRQIHLHRELASLAMQAWEDPRLSSQTDPEWLLVPVPLHWRRKRWRWFNQSFELARTIGHLRDLPVVQALHRVRSTPQQALLSRAERLSNLRGAFRLSKGARASQVVKNRPVLLIDDVYTTGSTAEECARVLREQGGAEKVVVLTVLRG